MEFDSINISIETFTAFFSQSSGQVVYQLMIIVGWLLFAFLFIYLGIYFYQEYRQNLHVKDWSFVVLAIDIPPNNFQTPKGVELLFAHLAGAYSKPDIAEAYRGGYVQPWFSFEIISIDGYIQFLVWTEEKLRDLVEATIYAQYPEAEITEVQDYTKEIAHTFPNDTHDMWAADFGLIEDDAFPIRTYPDFEHRESSEKEMVMKDPMSALLESFSRIGPGEQMWLQILVQPTSNDWKEKSIKKVKEMIGDTSSASANRTIDAISAAPGKLLEGIGDQIFAREAGEPEREGPKNQLQYLTPGEGKLIDAMEAKMAKLGFKTKIRGLYLARKEVFNPRRGVSALVGAINQFNVPSSNSLQPRFGVGASYFFKEQRSSTKKNLLMKAYKKRKMNIGANSYILNIEELATIWHFPMSNVKTPLLQKTEARQTEPPAGLPIELPGVGSIIPGGEDDTPEESEEAPGEERPVFKTDTGEVLPQSDLPYG